MADFLSLEDVLTLHADQVALYGGDQGVRDLGLLESAIAQPQATFGGECLHKDLFEMAAAYLFHIVQNHPFLDGNKRTGAVAALVFLDLNRVEITAPKGSVYEITMSVATGQAGKAEVAAFFRSHAH
jgi:death-on-curing protein